MLISIIMPLFNKELYVGRAISSVLRLTHADWELIVVDDGSADNGTDVVESFIDPRIRLIRLGRNCGVSTARNTGVSSARSNWVAFLDADDEYEPTFLEKVICFLGDNSVSNLSFIGTNSFSGQGTANPETLLSGVYDYLELFKINRSPTNSSSTVVSKKRFVEVGGFPENLHHCEDWFLWFKLNLVGKFVYIDEPLVRYHWIENSVSQRQTKPSDRAAAVIEFGEAVDEHILSHIDEEREKEDAHRFKERFLLSVAWGMARSGYGTSALDVIKHVRRMAMFTLYKRESAKIFVYSMIPNTLFKVTRKVKRLCQKIRLTCEKSQDGFGAEMDL